VILLREKVPALYTENIEFFPENAETKVFAYYRWSDEGMRAVVVANFWDTYLSGNSIPNFPAGTPAGVDVQQNSRSWGRRV